MESKSDREGPEHLLDDDTVERMSFGAIFEAIRDGANEGETHFESGELDARTVQEVTLLGRGQRSALVFQAAARRRTSGPDLQGEAVEALSALLRVIDLREDATLRTAAVTALGERLAALLESEAADGPPDQPGEQGGREIVGATVEALQKLDDPERMDSLKRVFITSEVRELAAMALANKLALARLPPKKGENETTLARMLGALIRADLNV